MLTFLPPLSIRLIFLSISHFVLVQVYCQTGPDTLSKRPFDTLPQAGFQNPVQVRQFYTLIKEPMPWLQQKPLQQFLLQFLQQADRWGLEPGDYRTGYVDSVFNNRVLLADRYDSLYADARITSEAIHLFHDLALGNIDQPVGYAGFRYTPNCLDIPGLLALAVANDQLQELPDALEPSVPAYITLKFALLQLLRARDDTTAARDDTTTARDVKKAIDDRLSAMGILNGRRLLPGRIRELNEALNTLRWVRCLQLEQCIIVNIPSATLDYYEAGKPALRSKVIVGKRSTPTSTLSSHITGIVLYPYWTVPSTIARRELLPLIKRDPAFLNENGYQVINTAGKLVDPVTVEWTKYSSTYFPYTLRQSTGCDNSLGIIKLNFYSPYGIYLHDTPWKSLFNTSKRYLSHGCVRVEKVAELARLLLKDDSTSFDGIIQQGDALNTKPTQISLARPVPVIIVYNTAWTDQSGEVRFYDDVYRKADKKHE